MLTEIRFAMGGKPLQESDGDAGDDKIKQACFLIRSKQYQQAKELLKDETSFFGQLLLSKVEYQLGNFQVAGDISAKAGENLPESADKKECDRWCTMMINKSLIELKKITHTGSGVNNLVVIDSIKRSPAQTEESKDEPVAKGRDWSVDPKYDWYQSTTHVYVTLNVKAGDLSQSLEVEYGKKDLVVTNEGVQILHVVLANDIVPAKSDYKVTPKQI